MTAALFKYGSMTWREMADFVACMSEEQKDMEVAIIDHTRNPFYSPLRTVERSVLLHSAHERRLQDDHPFVEVW